MPSPNPIPVLNKWSCCLAAVTWTAQKLGQQISQEEIIYKFGLFFPQWTHRAGVMERGDILNLLQYLGISYRKFYHLNDKEETLRLLNKFYPDYVAGFVLHRHPTNHCLAIETWDANTVTLMDSSPQAPAFIAIPWDTVFQHHDSDVLFIYK